MPIRAKFLCRCAIVFTIENAMKTILMVTMLFAAFGFVSCQSAPAKRYPIQGEVISVDAPRKVLTVKHGDIPGLMSAMTMGYEVADEREIASLKPGDKISAELVVSDNLGRLEHIVLVSHASDNSPPPQSK
jgi:Cu/Ag efflux protein CusF